ncbi:MAG: Hsp20/alpha crystallin family protein [Balneolaceae bacterium]|nr:Hsp20/alpha crystallin family protein [Balneolaceae bacterium]MBO6544928.1 Hsp20/alpha crystallin family protein [Balneolaceae bacterium]MBO6646324.1 Hsp20/alpha crystallin family protein [Balneolaceae bacterium]
MALIKYNRPNTDVFSRNFNDIVDEFFNNATTNYRKDNFMPSVDVSETDEQFEVSVELPGLKKEDIKVDLEKGRLTISGERKFKNEEEGKNFHRVETQYGKFSRSFYLPDSIHEDSITAKYEDGILNISIKKSEEKVKKQIEIA